jgi:hypothetical protein
MHINGDSGMRSVADVQPEKLPRHRRALPKVFWVLLLVGLVATGAFIAFRAQGGTNSKKFEGVQAVPTALDCLNGEVIGHRIVAGDRWFDVLGSGLDTSRTYSGDLTVVTDGWEPNGIENPHYDGSLAEFSSEGMTIEVLSQSPGCQ